MATKQNPRIVSVNTTAYDEENLILCTTLSDKQIIKILEPIVLAERDDSDNCYDNDDLVNALSEAYPLHFIEMYSEIPGISI